MAKRQITLSEEKLRNFISYSVARLLKEAYGKPIYDRHGEYDGYEDTKYGSDSFVFEPDIDKYLNDDIDFPEYPKVKVYFTRTEGMKGDGYMQPDDPDEYELDSWEIVNQEGMTPEVMNAVKQYMENDFDVEEAASEYDDLYEENRGVMAHFSGEGFKPKNPYENMTWDEYCAAKAREREEDAEKKRLHDLNYPEGEKENRGITTHFGGEKREKTPEDKERTEHMFDDNYWVDKMNLTKEDLAEMVNKSVRLIAEKINLNEISKGLLDRAREAAHKDMMRNFGDSKTRQKRERQWKKFGDEYRKMDTEEKDSICPQVDERDLVNMPEDTYVIMNGDGRDAVTANFRSSYSGRAGTKEQCEEYVKRFYDSGANWEYLPDIVPLKDYLRRK